MTESTIQLDLRTRVHRSGNRWAITRLQPDGHYDMVDAWEGNRRSLFRYLEEHNIHPSREAERQLDLLPERRGFREDTK